MEEHFSQGAGRIKEFLGNYLPKAVLCVFVTWHVKSRKWAKPVEVWLDMGLFGSVTSFILGFIVHVEGKKKILCLQFHSKPVVLTGSMEERWSLEIQDKGRVTCPTCRAVVRKTVEGLKKHMQNCRQVRTRKMSSVFFTPLQLTDWNACALVCVPFTTHFISSLCLLRVLFTSVRGCTQCFLLSVLLEVWGSEQRSSYFIIPYILGSIKSLLFSMGSYQAQFKCSALLLLSPKEFPTTVVNLQLHALCLYFFLGNVHVSSLWEAAQVFRRDEIPCHGRP